jgi:hypothetical protein
MPLEKTESYKSGEHFASEVVAALAKTKWGVTKPVPLVFYLYLPTEEAARSCVGAIQAAGLAVQVEPSAAGDGKWLCLCKAGMIPETKRLTEIGNVLMSLAKEKNGQFDGWETDLAVLMKKGCRRIVFRIVVLFALGLALLIYLLMKK